MGLRERWERRQVVQVVGFDDAPFDKGRDATVDIAGMVVGAEPAILARVLGRLTDRGRVPEPLRLAHLVRAAVKHGQSSKRA